MSGYKEEVLFPYLIRACKCLHLTEIEIALWSLCIESFKWDPKYLQLQNHLLFSAIIAKEQLLINPSLIDLYLTNLFNSDSTLAKKYKNWTMMNSMKVSFTPIQINEQYSVLRNASLSFYL